MTPDNPALAGPVAAVSGKRPVALTPLLGGCVAEVYRVDLEGGGALVAKVAPGGGLAVEGFMLDYLADHSALPVPATRHCDDRLLLMDYIPASGGAGPGAEEEAAAHLAALHGVTAPAYGFERDTVIGALPQPNGWQADWCGFFRDRRLLSMGRLALDYGRLPAKTFAQLEALCGKLETYIDPPRAPALLHGDIWSGNLLYAQGRVAAYIDPAIYYGDAEVELAYIRWLSTFGKPFFERYHALSPIDAGFWEVRGDIYALFPMLVHVEICGSPYDHMVAQTLQRYL